MDEIPDTCLIRAQEQAVRAEILNKDSAQPGHSIETSAPIFPVTL